MTSKSSKELPAAVAVATERWLTERVAKLKEALTLQGGGES
jgi:hypothetical protein